MRQTVQIIGCLWRKKYLITSLLFLLVEFSFTWMVGEKTIALASNTLAPPFQPTWVIDPTNPGEDAPPVGRSIFDHLVSRQQGEELSRYDIPFPFSALLRNIENVADSQSSSPRFKLILIPFGRSLHRYAAQPDFLRFPRILAAIDTDDIDTKSGTNHPPLHLKDRLFLAYQEKAAIIEVISYNEAAGRFEFQIVRNYQPDATPQVVYANRKVCTVCHQNQAPIFPEPLWMETSAHPTIHTLLQSSQTAFPAIAHGVDIASAFDAATDRSNAILVSQKFWKEGCEIPASPQKSIECRAHLLTYGLQQRLSGWSPFLGPSSSHHDDVRSSLLQTWESRWPNGLWLPNPNIPNRPLVDVLSFLVPDTSGYLSSPKPAVALTQGHPLMDPINTRPPLATWAFTLEDVSASVQVLTALANLFSQTDIQVLDRQLLRVAHQQHIPAIHYHSLCDTIIRSDSGHDFNVKLECRPSLHSQGESEPFFSLMGHVWFGQDTVQTGTLHLQIGNEEEYAHFGIRDSIFQKNNLGEIVFHLKPQFPGGLHARTREGNFIQSLVIKWETPLSQTVDSQERRMIGKATLSILKDFRLVEKAVTGMIQDTTSRQTDALGFAPFHRVKLVQSLLHHLDPSVGIWCCETPSGLPPIALDVHPARGKISASTNTPLAPLQLLDRYCGDCHHGVDPAPPNFLHGSVSRISENLTQCAERIYARLSMWKMGPTERGVPPMPPPTALPRLTPMPSSWPQQEEFRLLTQYFHKLISTKREPQPLNIPITPQGYAALPECLRPSAAQLSHQTDS